MDLRASRNDILANTNTYTQIQIFFLIFGLNSNKKSVRKCAELIRGTSARVVLKCEYINYLKDLNFTCMGPTIESAPILMKFTQNVCVDGKVSWTKKF